MYFFIKNLANFVLQDISKFTILTNDLQPLKLTGGVVPIPYLPRHDYVFLPGAVDNFLSVTHLDVVPECLQNYSYAVPLSQPEVNFLQVYAETNQKF